MIRSDNKGAVKAAPYIAAFLIPLLLTWIFYFLADTAPVGSRVIMTGDLDRQFVDFFSYFRSVITTHNDSFYTLEKNLGGDMPGFAAYYINDPLLFILFLFPGKHIAVGLSVLFSLQIAFCGLTFCIYLNNTPLLKAENDGGAPYVSVLFSTAYAMNGFVFGYQVLMIYFSNLIILPVILLMFDKLISERKKRYMVSYSLLLALYIYMNYYMGFMLMIFLALYYISYLIREKSYIKSFVLIAVPSAAGVLISSFSLIPTVLSLEGEKSSAAADWSIYRKFSMLDLPGSFFSGMARNDRMPLIYCSVFVLICALCRLAVSGGRLGDIFLIISLSVSMYINPLDNIWHGFNNPVGFPWRYSYFLSIVFLIMGYRWFNGYIAGCYDNKILYACIITVLYFVYMIVTHDHYFDTERRIVNICFAAANIGVIYFMKTDRVDLKKSVIVLSLILAADLCYNSITVYKALNGEGQDFAVFYERYDDTEAAIDYVKQSDDSLYRIEKDFYRTPNDPMMFDYIGITHSSSCEKESVRHFLSRFGFRDTGLYAFYNLGSTTFADCFLGIRYYISRFDEVHKPYEYMEGSHERIGKYYAFKNPYAFNMVFFAPKKLADVDIESGNTFEMQNHIANAYGADDIYIKAEYEQDHADFPDLGYHIKVQRDGPLYYYFDAPAMQAAKVYVNGEDREPYFTDTNWSVLCAGVYKTGDEVDIVLKALQDELKVTEACFYYEDTAAIKGFYEAAYDERTSDESIREDILTVVTSSHLKGELACKDAGYITFTMPYDRAWRINLDGNRTEPVRMLGELLAVEVDEGTHEIEMQYVPDGLIVGVILSFAGLLLLVVYVVSENRRKMGSY